MTSANSGNIEESIRPGGKLQVLYKFVEEPLGVPADAGHGYARFVFGESIGPENRYTIVRKLCWQTDSSVWMARDEQENTYVAIKALKGAATKLARPRHKLDALMEVSTSMPSSIHCLQYITYFMHNGIEQDGEHLCIVTELFGANVGHMIKKALPPEITKRILLHTLRGLAHLHQHGILHNDLKPANIMYDHGGTPTEGLSTWLEGNPSQWNSPESSWYGKTVQSAVSQPLSLHSSADAMKRSYLIKDFGIASYLNDNLGATILVPENGPESILGLQHDKRTDIWKFGCLIFEILTQTPMFTYEGNKTELFDSKFSYLWQMRHLTGEETFPVEMREANESLFNELGGLVPPLRGNLKIFSREIKTHRDLVGDRALQQTFALMRRCLRLNPALRPSADELLKDPYWDGVQ